MYIKAWNKVGEPLLLSSYIQQSSPSANDSINTDKKNIKGAYCGFGLKH